MRGSAHLVLAGRRAENEDRLVGLARQRIGHATHPEAGHPTVAVARDDDEIRAALVREAVNRFGHGAVEDRGVQTTIEIVGHTLGYGVQIGALTPPVLEVVLIEIDSLVLELCIRDELVGQIRNMYMDQVERRAGFRG